MGVRIVKKKVFKSISYLLAVVLILSTTFSRVAFASGEVNAEEAESPALEITLEITIKTESEKSQPEESHKREAAPAKTVEETGSGTPEDPKVKTTTTVETDEEYDETTTTVEKEKNGKMRALKEKKRVRLKKQWTLKENS